jgi:hypothetical protein
VSAWLISHQPAVLFSQPTVFFSQNKSAPAISHQPNEQTVVFPSIPLHMHASLESKVRRIERASGDSQIKASKKRKMAWCQCSGFQTPSTHRWLMHHRLARPGDRIILFETN